jgi:hypothetical protein
MYTLIYCFRTRYTKVFRDEMEALVYAGVIFDQAQDGYELECLLCDNTGHIAMGAFQLAQKVAEMRKAQPGAA